VDHIPFTLELSFAQEKLAAFDVRLPRVITDVPATHRDVALGRSGGQSDRTTYIWDNSLFRWWSHGDLISPNYAHGHTESTYVRSPNVLRRSVLVYVNSFQFWQEWGGRQHDVVEPLRLRSADLVAVAAEKFPFASVTIR
jgi:hypothetical protein